MDLSQVSRTANLLLICRAVESEKNPAEFYDPMAVICLERLLSSVSEADRRWMLHHRRRYAGLGERDAKAGVRRGRAIDQIASRFIAARPGCTVINLACGFDTRFWRMEHERCAYLEIDLPEVIALKKDLLQDQPAYPLIGCSVLDTAWIDQVTAQGNANFLLIAEGLFMWFPPAEAIRLFQEIGQRFTRSQLILDMVPEKYTRGLWKRFIRLHSRLDWGLDAAWEFGIRTPRELEDYSPGFKVVGEEKGSAGPILTVAVNGD